MDLLALHWPQQRAVQQGRWTDDCHHLWCSKLDPASDALRPGHGDSLPIAGILPNLPQTADFTRVVWPQNTQKALLGQIQPDEMMQTFEKLFFG